VTPSEAWHQLRAKGMRYWFVVAFLTTAGAIVGQQLGREQIWIRTRYRIYQATQDTRSRRAYARNTAVVLIPDDEYWKGDLAGRAPIKRDYLARLLRKLDQINPAVIALDFNLRSPTPDGNPPEHPGYQSERRELLDAIREIANRRHIVLPKTINQNDKGDYVTEADIYDGIDTMGAKFGSEENHTRIHTGYIALPRDLRLVPLHLPLAAGAPLDSFSEAIVRAYSPEALNHVEMGPADSLPYGSYLPETAFPTCTAREVLEDSPDCAAKLAHKIVLVGGVWHQFAYNRGPPIDSYLTPVGEIDGVFIHANYVEALLDLRTYPALSDGTVTALEITLIILMVIFFALQVRPYKRTVAVILTCAILLLANYFLLQNLGRFFDVFVPLMVIVGHAIWEQVRDWRSLAATADQRREV
jgi:CHASE2 domain-containing sensor protein